MAKQAVVVTYRVKPGRMDELLTSLRAHIRRTKANEPGCVQFDVLVPHDEPDVIRLHEVYADEAAFDAHNASEHLARYKVESATLLDDRAVTWCRVDEAS